MIWFNVTKCYIHKSQLCLKYNPLLLLFHFPSLSKTNVLRKYFHCRTFRLNPNNTNLLSLQMPPRVLLTRCHLVARWFRSAWKQPVKHLTSMLIKLDLFIIPSWVFIQAKRVEFCGFPSNPRSNVTKIAITEKLLRPQACDVDGV